MTTFDPVQALEARGFQLEQLPQAHREALQDLSPEEVNTLIAIRERIASKGDVEGFVRGENNNGYFIY